MEDSLKILVNILESKYSTILKTSSKDSNWIMHFPIPFELEFKFNYELGLMFFSVYNTILILMKVIMFLNLKRKKKINGRF